MNYSIGTASAMCGLSIDTLRFYEKNGLLHVNRDANNRRYYTDRDLEWIAFLTRLKEIGMSLKNMKEYADLRYQGDETVSERLRMLFDQMDLLKQERNKLDKQLDFLERKIKKYLKIE
ncbi:MerR family transcriptional regulator [Furfurilactobacillus curtus]|uniref:MerR family transcriptional regulator n=1 Tax=Furfurilactobacillus curtus TaxID=1746200 RepID=A0ABQ5JLP6_9LACO